MKRRNFLKNSLLATGFPYDRQSSRHNNIPEVAAFIKSAQGVRRPGCAALDMAYVAAGRLDGYWEFSMPFIFDKKNGLKTEPDEMM